MYNIGTFIVYGKSGVCRVAAITSREFPGLEEKQSYYVLDPIYQKGTIYSPVDKSPAFMRAVMSVYDIDRLIALYPYLKAEAESCADRQQFINRCQNLMTTQGCLDLFDFIMPACAQKPSMSGGFQSAANTEKSFMRQGEEILFEEIAVVYGLDKKDVPDFIMQRNQPPAKKQDKKRGFFKSLVCRA